MLLLAIIIAAEQGSLSQFALLYWGGVHAAEHLINEQGGSLGAGASTASSFS